MNICLLKQIAATTICVTLCLSVVSCHDGAVSFDTEDTENESSHVTMKEQEVTTDISDITETITDVWQFETETTENSISTEEITEPIFSETTLGINQASEESELVSDKSTEGGFAEELLVVESIEDIIDRNLDILMEGSESFYSGKEIIEEHPESFMEIVEIGDDALAYLDIVIETYPFHLQYDSENKRGLLAMIAAYTIQPDLYDQKAISPDGKYSLKAVVYSFEKIWDPFVGIEYYISIIDNETDSILISSDEIYTFPFSLFETGIHWSADSRYLVLEQKYRNYPHTIDVFDVFMNQSIPIPGENDVEQVAGITLEYYSEERNQIFDCVQFDFKELYENLLTVDVTLSNHFGGGYTLGWYVYDLVQHEIIDLSISLP